VVTSRFVLLSAVPVGLALLATGCSSSDAPPAFTGGGNTGPLPSSSDGRLLGGPCPFVAPPGRTVLCGTFDVPEDRSSASSASRLKLAVAVFKGDSADAAKSPVVYLEGGPGGGALSDVVAGIRAFEPLLPEHDLVVLDQRGTGYSTPSLDCTESVDAKAADASAAELDAVARCRARLSETVNLAHFDTAANAADVRELRSALGYATWNLFGVSYGTRLALEVLRQGQDGVRSAVIDSVLPVSPDVANAHRVLEHTGHIPDGWVGAGGGPGLMAVPHIMIAAVAAAASVPFSSRDSQVLWITSEI